MEINYKDKYKKYSEKKGGNLYGRNLNSAKRLVNDFFEDSLNFEVVSLTHSDGTVEKNVSTNIIYKGNIPSIKNMVVKDGFNLYAGDLVERKNGDIWLCEILDPTVVNISGTIEKCNWILKWIDNIGQIQSHPVVVKSESNASGIDQGDILSMPTGMRQIVMQHNKHTEKLKRGFRFFIGSEIFSISNYDSVSKKGIMQIGLVSDQYNSATDNKELGIADYTQVSAPEIVLNDLSEMTLKVGQTEQIDLRVVNRYGTIDLPVFYKTSDSLIAEVDSKGLIKVVGTGEVMITAYLEQNLDSKTIKINAIAENDPDPDPVENNRAEILGKNEIVYSYKEPYKVTLYKNNTPISKNIVFSITDTKGNSTKMASIFTQNAGLGECVVQAISFAPYPADIVLHAKTTDGSHNTSKIIRIKNFSG